MLRHIECSEGNRGVVILGMVLAILSFLRLPMQAQNTAVSGVIKNMAGEPVAGALVKVRSADSGLTFLVVSQAQGRYSTPNLPPGKYTVEGIGGGYQSEPAGPVEVRGGQPGKMDLVLKTPQKVYPPERKMTNADYAKWMPEGEGKKLITTRCILCHGLERPVPRRAPREDWQKVVNRMRLYLQDRRVPLSDQERDTILDYAVKNFGPDSPPFPREQPPTDPNRNLPRTLLKGAEAKYIAVELDLRGFAGVYDIAVDSQGIAWVSEEKPGKSRLGRFDRKALAYTRIALPPAKFPHALGSLAVDPRDNVWIVDLGPRPDAVLYEYNPKSKEFANTYDIPSPPPFRSPLNTLRFHPDGSIWAAGIVSNRIVKLDPVSRKITDYPVQSGSQPYDNVIGGENTIWYTANYDNGVVKLDPDTGKLTHYKVPTRKSDLRRMEADGDGNIWVAALEAGKLLKVDYRTGEVTEFTPPTKDSGPQSVDVDRKRNLIWFNERYTDKVARFDPRTNTFVEFPLPNADNDGRRVLLDPTNPNRLWWDARIGKIGYVEVME